MFLAPKRANADTYEVQLSAPMALGIRLAVSQPDIITPVLEYQSVFQTLQRRILVELTKNRQLFKNAPSIESLEAITPNWGFITTGDTIQLSPYTLVSIEPTISAYPRIIDLELTALHISRSTIRPLFRGVALADNLIEFDWMATSSAAAAAVGIGRGAELEEVSDVAYHDVVAGVISLKDPDMLKREKLAAKERVRSAYRDADAAREAADGVAANFHLTYDLSDTESAFSEWASDSDSDTSEASN
jgi:hypothetical protein